MVQVLVGDNAYLIDQRLKQAADSISGGEYGLEKVEGADIEADELIQLVSAGGLFASERLVIVKQPSDNKNLADKIGQVIDAAGASAKLILIEPKPDKRSTYWKTLQKKADIVACEQPDERAAAGFVSEYVGQNRGTISGNDAVYLVNRLGLDQLRIKNELDKLLDYSHTISRQSIDLLTEPQLRETIFMLLDDLGRGEGEKAMGAYRSLRAQKHEPHYVLSMVGWQLHNLLLVYAAKRSGAGDLAAATKLSPFVVSKTQNLLGNINHSQLRQALAWTVEADERLKTTKNDPDELVESLLVRLAGLFA